TNLVATSGMSPLRNQFTSEISPQENNEATKMRKLNTGTEHHNTVEVDSSEAVLTDTNPCTRKLPAINHMDISQQWQVQLTQANKELMASTTKWFREIVEDGIDMAIAKISVSNLFEISNMHRPLIRLFSGRMRIFVEYYSIRFDL
ncbi:hypothetical protein BGZ49_006249, partial [Haplosporangium sp. Z 27]